MERSQKLLSPIVILFLFYTCNTFCQTTSDKENYYIWFDGIVGVENSGLFDGLRYKEHYLTQNNNHKFFISQQFLKGNITYDNQPYYAIELKYDIYENDIIVNLEGQSGKSILKLNSDRIDNFTVNGITFHRIITKNSELNGFYTVLYQNSNITSYKSYRKSVKKYIYKKNVYYQFTDFSDYLLKVDSNFYAIQSKSDLIKIFPFYKNEINFYYNNNHKLQKSDYDLFLKQLIQNISSLIQNTKASAQ
jgi:hypothetical protein